VIGAGNVNIGSWSIMPTARSFQGRTIKETGKINFDMPSRVCEHIKGYPDDTRMSVEFKKFYKKRTPPQNKYLHKAVTLLGDHYGYEMWEMKYAMKELFLKFYDDNGFPHVKKTSRLDTVEFEKFAEKMRMWAASFDGFYLMTPGEYWESVGVEKK
jgi:hypothetical protein